MTRRAILRDMFGPFSENPPPRDLSSHASSRDGDRDRVRQRGPGLGWWVATYGCCAASLLSVPQVALAEGSAPQAAASAASDADVTLDEGEARRAHALSRELMSPFCPGNSLASCSSPAAAEWRQEIRQWVDHGATSEEIRERLQARVPGFPLLGRPESAWGWWVPVLAALAASFGFFFLMMRRRGAAVAKGNAPANEEASAAQLDAVDRALDELDDRDD